MWRKGNPFALLVGMQTGAAIVGRVWRHLTKLMDLPFDPAIPLLGIYPKKPPKKANSKEHKQPYVHCSIIYNRQDLEAAQRSISR